MLRLLHNRSIVKYFLAALGIAFAFYFAWSFYPFGEWVGNHFLQDAPGGPKLLGLVSAAILGGCVLIVVFYKEYIKEDTIAYSLATGDQSFANAFKWFVFFVLGLELFSVLFRAILLNFSPVSWVMLGVGVLGMAVTYVVGKILHVQMNRPPSVAARYMREEAGRSVFEEGHKLARGKSLTTAQKRQIWAGNPQPIDDIRDAKAAEREREVKAVEERRRIAEENDREQKEFYQRMLAPTPDAISSTSSNGHSSTHFKKAQMRMRPKHLSLHNGLTSALHAVYPLSASITMFHFARTVWTASLLKMRN